MKKYEGSTQAYNVVVEHNVMTPMPDGVKLAADIYFPALDGGRAEGAFPVILERTPYNKAAPAQVTKGKYFARRGYVCVIQDVRGRFASEGEWYAFAKEADDGYATVEWLGTQPWSTGKVGTMGDSYAGSDQSALATLNPPHLATMIVAVGASNYYHSSMRHNGALEQRFLIYAFRMAATSKEAEADPALKTALQQVLMEKIPELVRQFPLKAGTTLLRRLPSYERWALDVLTHADYDDYWKGFRGYTPSEFYDEHADVPTLYWGGWYDSYARNTPESYVRSQRPQAVAAVPADGAMDARPIRGDVLGRPGLRHRGARQLPGHEAVVVRPLAEGLAQRSGGLAAGTLFHHGNRRWPPRHPRGAGRPRRFPGAHPSRRHLAQRRRLAAAADALCTVFSAS